MSYEEQIQLIKISLLPSHHADLENFARHRNMSSESSQPLIAAFVEKYKKNLKHYEDAAKSAELTCRKALTSKGISHSTSSRAKDPNSLRTKLETRQREKGPYKDEDAICSDIVDLIEARIVFDNEADEEMIKATLEEHFEIHEEKRHGVRPVYIPTPNIENGGYSRNFPEYVATHYRVRLKEDCSQDSLGFKSGGLFEIQVRTALADLCARYNHYFYKSETTPDEDDQWSLDNFNGLMIIGQSFARHMDRIKERRQKLGGRPFVSVAEVEIFFEEWVQARAKPWSKNGKLGSSEALARFLKGIDRNNRDSLRKLLQELDLSIGPGSESSFPGVKINK